jgi:hypothetical protein
LVKCGFLWESLITQRREDKEAAEIFYISLFSLRLSLRTWRPLR